jgi:23S rRNA pseudouridine2605 synthase
MMEKSLRLNKALAMLGICSRREADRLISSGQIRVNGQMIDILGSFVFDEDIITVKNKIYPFKITENCNVWLYYKPIGLVTTHKDEKDRKTIFDDVKTKLPERVISVGRLDINSEGLILLTNNGVFARYAESPTTGWERFYRVRLFGELSRDVISELADGPRVNGIRYAPVKASIIRRTDGKNFWMNCILKEGKNREIRLLFNHFGLQVNRLIRYKYGPYSLENLQPGQLQKSTLQPTFFSVTSK